jgi:hypothetical protein
VIAVTAPAFRQLDRSLHDHLADVMRLASYADDRTVAGLARDELPRIVTALEALLDEHQPDDHGRCPTCRTRWLSRRAPTPCRAYLAAHISLTFAAARGEHG